MTLVEDIFKCREQRSRTQLYIKQQQGQQCGLANMSETDRGK